MIASRANKRASKDHKTSKDHKISNVVSPKKKMISLVLKDHVIRYIDSKRPHLHGVTAFGEHFLESGIIQEGKIIDAARLASILKECIRKWKIQNREVQFLVPDSVIIVRKVDIPLEVKDEEIKGHLYLELGTSLHLPFDNPIFDVDFLEEKEDKKEILLFAAPEQVVNEYAQILKSVGLKPIAADVSSLAIYRLFYKVYGDSETTSPEGATTLSIQFNLQDVTVSIINHHKLLLVRQFKMNLAIENWEHGTDRDGTSIPSWVGDEDYLKYEVNVMMSEIERVINFYSSLINHQNDGIETFLLTGDYPYLEDIASDLERTFGKTPLTFHNELFDTQSKELIIPKYYLTLGLSLKGGV
ncbi:type IV pilus biogenesis protein PilM [Paenibacillus pini]|uniref:Type IV pilus biogenesis protein PilM n=1 Tax=Paenibacillus pini JCM 16418 TaxID=1236976 RepID=W7YX39_9BACL|nr:pilus assembly protein PilM [Paenibacillus pini]GAF09276.1 type IV pilus biogenesis protein PilM [Paenibacillus pini JCM 16418]